MNVRILKRSSVVNLSASLVLHGRMENAPGGRCGARESVSPIIKAPIGVRVAGFSTNGQLRMGWQEDAMSVPYFVTSHGNKLSCHRQMVG